MSGALTPADVERASSWHIVIADILIPADITFADEHGARHWPELGLHIDLGTGAIRWPRAKVFGDRTVWFIRSLQRECHQIKYSREEGEAWLKSFLDKPERQGLGPLDPKLTEENETRRIANAERANEILAEAVDIIGTDGERYLESRGLPAPWPLALKWRPNMRAGEGAIIAPLTALGRVVAILITYITALATKSLVAPPRRRLNIEADHPGACILIADREPGAVNIVADTIITEGLENGEALARVRQPGWRLLALVGINTLQNIVPERAGERIIIFQDSDPEGHPAREALERGIDALKLAGAAVRCTAFSEFGDANDILRHQDGGEAELTRLLQTSALAPLSFEREAEHLAKLPPTEYEKARKRVAEEQGVRVSHLDREVARLRPKPADGEEDSTGGWDKPPKDEPWGGPIPPLGTLLDTASAAMPAFLVAPKAFHDVITLWSAASYLVQSQEIALPVMPQLALQSIGPESGKSTALEIAASLCYRGVLRSSYTASTLFRRINEQNVTYCLADLHTILTDPRSEIHAVIKSCHRRAEAFVDRTEEGPGGKRYVATYRCWAALAWASIGPMTAEMHSRAIVLPLQPALPEESAGLDHSSPSRSSVLIDVRRQLAAWAATVHPLPAPTMPPSLYSRSADNWRPLLTVAELAGGDWPQRALAAIEEVRKMKPRPDLRERLLVAIRDAFDSQARKDAEDEAAAAGKPPPEEDDLAAVAARPGTRLSTLDLLDALNSDEESGLGEANHGRPITAYWLRDHLHGLLDPPGSQEWQDSSVAGRKHVRGYGWHQLADAYRRHLPSARGVTVSGTSGTSGTASASVADLAEIAVPDAREAPSDPGHHPGQEISRDAAGLESDGADVPDVPDAGRGVREDMPAGDVDTFRKLVRDASSRGGHVGLDSAGVDGSSPPAPRKPQANGADSEGRPGSPAGDPLLVNSILGYVELHPEASARKIASALGIKTSMVERVLAAWGSSS
jgi:putative DNA primase/helicase